MKDSAFYRALHGLLVAGAVVIAVFTAPAGAVSNARMAPDFTLRSAAGDNLRLKEQRGQVVMLNFWATWCGPCREEMPHLNRLFEKYHAAGFMLFGVNVDNDARNARGMASRLGLQFPVLLDTDKKVSRLYDLETMPSTMLIDRDGRLRFVRLGYKSGYEADYEKQIRELLKE
jgi:peroxiredoxin